MKIFLWIVGIIVLVLVLAIGAAALLFDPNSLRGTISAKVGESVHRKLDIGDIHLTIFPTLGARVRDVKLSNAEGFGEEPMAQVGEAQLGVRIVPLLFDHRAEVSSITLKDLHLNLLKHADGKSNWDDLVEEEKKPEGKPKPAPQPQVKAGGEAQLDKIGGIDIDNANISYVDQQAKKSYALSKFKLSTGSITPGKPFDFTLAFHAALADPAVNADFDAGGRLGFDDARKLYEVQDLKAALDATGAGVPGGKQSIKLSAGVTVDGDKGTFKLADGKLGIANLDIRLALDGSGLDSDAPRYSGPLSVAAFNPRDTFKALGLPVPATADAEALKQLSLAAQVEGGKESARLNNLAVKLDQSNLNGNLAIISFKTMAAQFSLKLDQIDADRYLPPPEKRNPVAASDNGKAGEGDNAPLPLDKLDGFNAEGRLDIASLKLKNLKLANVELKLAADKGAQKSIDLGAALYGGTLSSATRLGPGARPTLGETLKLASINAGPLLLDFMGKDYVSGNGNFNLDVTSAGHTVNEIKHGLNGSTSLALQNGAVKGFNLAQIIREGQALQAIAGGKAPAQQGGSAQQTDFTTLTASGRIANGVLHSEDLNGASPLLRLSGAGNVDIANSTLDYTAKPMLVNTAGGQGGKELGQLKSIVVPVRVYGPFAAPKYQLDVAGVLQQEAVQKLTEKLGGQKGGDLVNTLQGLFGKKAQQQQQPPPKP